MLLVGKMEDRQKILTAMSSICNLLTTLGKFALLLFMDREDDVSGQTFLSKALAFAENIPFCCKKISMADRPVVDMATHKEMVTWIAYSTPESKCKPTALSSAAVFTTLRLMPPGQTLNKVACLGHQSLVSMSAAELEHSSVVVHWAIKVILMGYERFHSWVG